MVDFTINNVKCKIGDRWQVTGEQGSNKQMIVYGFLPHLTINLLFLIVNFIKNILQGK
jgi:hypothetical protein